MIRAAIAAILLIVAAGGGTAGQARGIDCTKATTRLEKVICADPTLRDRDGQIAALYTQALDAWHGAIAAYVRRDQAIWLARFRMIGTAGADEVDCAIGDRPCIQAELDRRIATLSSGTYANGGVYVAPGGGKLLLMPGVGNGYTLRVYDPAHLPEAQVVTLDESGAAMWDGPDFMLARMGDMNGLPLPRPKNGPEIDGCTLRLAPAALSIRVWQKGLCAGRDYAGTYRRDLNEQLSDYEVELH